MPRGLRSAGRRQRAKRLLFWNIKDFSTQSERFPKSVIREKILPAIANHDVTFLQEVRNLTTQNAREFCDIIRREFNKDMDFRLVDAADPTTRNEKYAIFFDTSQVTPAGDPALLAYGNASQPYGRQPVVFDTGDFKVSAWHAPGPANAGNDHQNVAYAMAHAAQAHKQGVEVFGGDFNYNSSSGAIGRHYTFTDSDKPTTVGGNSYDRVATAAGVEVVKTSFVGTGVSDHYGKSVEVQKS